MEPKKKKSTKFLKVPKNLIINIRININNILDNIIKFTGAPNIECTEDDD